MTLAHILGLPVEEGVLQLAPVAAATTVLAIAAGTTLGRLFTRRRRRGLKQ